MVLLVLRITIREDLVARIAELTYETTLRLPGQLYVYTTLLNAPNYIDELANHA